jgi:hypothetical protein
MVSPILFTAAAILWVTDVISQAVFITLVILETAITMGLVIWQVRRQQAADAPEDIQTRVDEVTADSPPEA